MYDSPYYYSQSVTSTYTHTRTYLVYNEGESSCYSSSSCNFGVWLGRESGMDGSTSHSVSPEEDYPVEAEAA